MTVDLVFVDENTSDGHVSVIKNCNTMKEAQARFNELENTTKVEYAYIRKFVEYRYHIVKWLKRKDAQ